MRLLTRAVDAFVAAGVLAIVAGILVAALPWMPAQLRDIGLLVDSPLSCVFVLFAALWLRLRHSRAYPRWSSADSGEAATWRPAMPEDEAELWLAHVPGAASLCASRLSALTKVQIRSLLRVVGAVLSLLCLALVVRVVTDAIASKGMPPAADWLPLVAVLGLGSALFALLQCLSRRACGSTSRPV